LGFKKDIEDVLKFLPKDRQTLFFSATIDKTIKKTAYSLIKGNAIHIQISPNDPVSKNIEHSVSNIQMDDKRFFLERIIKENPASKMLIFVRTKVRAERVAAAMKRVFIDAETIHGGVEQADRFSVMERFKTGETKILIATDVSSRGIDIPLVEFVVNYDIPEQPENYVHRIGRTGRGKMKGFAISFWSKEEKPLLEEIEKLIGKTIHLIQITKANYKETINFKVEEEKDDWQSVMDQIETIDKGRKKKKKR